MANEVLVKEKRHTLTHTYDSERPDDLLSVSDSNVEIVYKSKDGTIYPEGKVVRSDTVVKNNTYEYEKDEQGNILGCIVTTTIVKNGQAIDTDKGPVISYYDGLGRVVKIEHYTKTKIVFNREQFWYWGDTTTIRKKTVKSTDVLTTSEYNTDGKAVLIWSKTLKSGAINKKYEAIYDASGECTFYTDYDRKYTVQIDRDKDFEGHLLALNKTFRRLNDRAIFSKKCEIYNPNAEYKLAKVIENNIVKELYMYNLNAQVIKAVKTSDDGTVIETNYEYSVDPETNERTEEEHIYITRPHNRQHSKYIKKTFDADNNLLVFAEDNSKVTTYTYEDGKRMTAITKQLISGEFTVIDSIVYSYTEDKTSELKTRTETGYTEDGSIRFTREDVETNTPIQKYQNVVFKIYETDDEI